MPIDTPNRKLQFVLDDYKRVRDTIIGEPAIKAESTTYLPSPPGLIDDNNREILQNNSKYVGVDDRYTFYLTFADFPEIVAPTLAGFQGLIQDKPPKLELPSSISYLEETATPAGDSFSDLWSTITSEVAAVGRIGLLLELFGDDVFVCTYTAENIINWKARTKSQGGGLELLILREIREEPNEDDPYVMEEVEFFRELSLSDDDVYRVRLFRKTDTDEFEQIVIEGTTDETLDGDGFFIPQYFGSPLDFIPLQIINALDLSYDVGPIPSIPMVRRALSIYRKSADYNRSLYNKADPQAYIAGISEDSEIPGHIGGGTIWSFRNPDTQVGYLDVDGDGGIPLQEKSINNEYMRFYREAGRLIEESGRNPESGTALERRQNSSQVTLKSMVLIAGEGLRLILQTILDLRGGGGTVVFVPDTDFAEAQLQGRDLLDIMQARNQGAPLSKESIHGIMVRGGLTEMEFEDEIELIENEPIDESLGMVGRDIPSAGQRGSQLPGSQTVNTQTTEVASNGNSSSSR